MEQECLHRECTNIDGINVCDECGIQLEEHFVNNERFTIESKSLSRCHPRKDMERSLYKDLQDRKFPQNIIEKADEYYKKIIDGEIYRANKRLAIVFFCTFQAYMDIGEPQSAPELAKKFNINKKTISLGFTIGTEHFRNNVHKRYISPLDLVPRILSQAGITDYLVYYKDIEKIYNYVESVSVDIKTSIPQSVAAGLVYFYLKLKDNPITKTEFSKIVNLTEITFVKIANCIAEMTGSKIKI